MKLNLLLNAKKIQHIIQNKWFLTPEEIVCLNLEFGIPQKKLQHL